MLMEPLYGVGCCDEKTTQNHRSWVAGAISGEARRGQPTRSDRASEIGPCVPVYALCSQGPLTSEIRLINFQLSPHTIHTRTYTLKSHVTPRPRFYTQLTLNRLRRKSSTAFFCVCTS